MLRSLLPLLSMLLLPALGCIASAQSTTMAETPNIEKYDGSFHRIVVWPLRTDILIQTRTGYSAVPPER